jgi:hypothetical protein
VLDTAFQPCVYSLCLQLVSTTACVYYSLCLLTYLTVVKTCMQLMTAGMVVHVTKQSSDTGSECNPRSGKMNSPPWVPGGKVGKCAYKPFRLSRETVIAIK